MPDVGVHVTVTLIQVEMELFGYAQATAATWSVEPVSRCKIQSFVTGA